MLDEKVIQVLTRSGRRRTEATPYLINTTRAKIVIITRHHRHITATAMAKRESEKEGLELNILKSVINGTIVV